VFEARMRDSGFILTTSLPRYAKRFCRRAAILHQGRLELYDDMDRAIWEFERLERPPVSAGLVQQHVPEAGAEAAD
jgi:ABC-type multidrug transport system ATPase subunit